MNANHWILWVVGILLFPSAALALGGDERGPVEKPAAADAEAPLPTGWPGATDPGVIEVKTYPAYRSAVARSKSATMKSQPKLFWPLFSHIQREGIAMTTPVVMTYQPEVVEHPGTKGEVSMEFLYRRPDQGAKKPVENQVAVEDKPSATFVCIGVQGVLDEARMTESLTRLRSWLDEHKREWVEAGPPRQLGYHGPGTPLPRQLNEVQIPVKRTGGEPTKPARGGE